MPLNVGYIEVGGGGIAVRVYYDTTFSPVGGGQPLVNGPRGFCLDITNTTGRNAQLTVDGLSGSPQTFNVNQGDPITSGQSRSRTAGQMAGFGFSTRGNVGAVTVTIPPA